jgi:hypothetical protein
MVAVPEHVYGFPGLAHGGYVAGLLAERYDGSAAGVRVDFRRPVVPGSPLDIRSDGDTWLLEDGAGPVSLARPDELSLDVPNAPTWEQALAATGEYLVETPGTSPDCFGCGLGRAEGGGLRQFLGRVPGRPLVAAAWRPSAALADDDGILPDRLTWASLDCPGGRARFRLTDAPSRTVTASLAARILRPVTTNEPHVAFGWLIGRDGRKTTVGSAISTVVGDLCAIANALWLDMP